MPVVKDADRPRQSPGNRDEIATKAAAKRRRNCPTRKWQGLDVHHHQSRAVLQLRLVADHQRTERRDPAHRRAKRRPVAVGDAMAIHPVGIIGMVIRPPCVRRVYCVEVPLHLRIRRAAGLVQPSSADRVRPGMSEAESIDDTDGAGRPFSLRAVLCRARKPSSRSGRRGTAQGRIDFDGSRAGLLQPGHVGELWHVVYRVASAEGAGRCQQSQYDIRLAAHGEEVMSTAHEQRITHSRPGPQCRAGPRQHSPVEMFVVETSVVIFGREPTP